MTNRVGYGGESLRIAIRNHDGIIYREIEAVGPGQLIDAIQAFADLGFKDELEHATVTKDGYHAIFRK
ncbi:MAG: hypothetical protein V4627_01360 [Pseudomonadota bacterium]